MLFTITTATKEFSERNLNTDVYELFGKKNHNYKNLLGFPGGSQVKNLPASAGDMGFVPGRGRSHVLWLS